MSFLETLRARKKETGRPAVEVVKHVLRNEDYNPSRETVRETLLFLVEAQQETTGKANKARRQQLTNEADFGNLSALGRAEIMDELGLDMDMRVMLDGVSKGRRPPGGAPQPKSTAVIPPAETPRPTPKPTPAPKPTPLPTSRPKPTPKPTPWPKAVPISTYTLPPAKATMVPQPARLNPLAQQLLKAARALPDQPDAMRFTSAEQAHVARLIGMWGRNVVLLSEEDARAAEAFLRHRQEIVGKEALPDALIDLFSVESRKRETGKPPRTV